MDNARERVESATVSSIKVGDIEFPPLRRLDDFVTAARFQLPPFSDLEKWNNRMCANMLYYQSNYFVLTLAVFAIIGMIHPHEVLTGAACIGGVIGVVVYICSNNPDALNFKRQHPVFSIVGMAIIIYLLISVMSSVVIFLYGLLMPILLCMIHASLRMRNLENKISTTMNKIGVQKTVMGRLFEQLAINPNAF